MRVKLAVIADDLTGANDTGAQYAKKGLETIVLTKFENIEQVKDEVDVIVVDTESRADSKENAYEKVKKVAKIIKKIGINVIYKKIDSTLRGNIGAEFDAIMDTCNIDVAILDPAFPANGRITIGGFHLLNQIPLSLTEISKDPLTPVKESHVPTLIKAQTKRPVIHIPISKVMRPASLESELRRIKEGEGGIVVLDTVTQDDLKTIAKTLAKIGLEKLCGGPAGLAEEMPEALGLVICRPAVLISGSVSEITMRQIRRAEKVMGVQAIKLNVQRILEKESLKREEILRVLKSLKANIANNEDSIVTSAISKENVKEDIEFGNKLGLSNVEISREIASTFGKIASEIAKEEVSGMVITGGAIAISVLRVLEALGLRVREEIMPGIPISQIMGGKFDGLKIATKAGAFGNEEALANCLKQLKRRF